MMSSFKEFQVVIVNTGGKDSFGVVHDSPVFVKQLKTNEFIYTKSNKGYYWKEQDSYRIRFENGTSQYIPAKYIRKAPL